MGMEFNPVTETVEIGGRRFVVSALPCNIVRRELLPLVQELDQGKAAPDQLERMLALCHRSVSWAEPLLDLDALEGALTMADAVEMFQHVVRVSTLPRDAG